ncbi:MAG TPA: hypothetical protein PKV66_00135 [Candidatus Pelethenecus sp.]|nr:hypothetical protein [Candidatus Pelethenecus sp.]
MAITQTKPIIVGKTEVENVYKKETGYFLFFPFTKWVKVSAQALGNDIFIQTEEPVRQIYFNGKELLTPSPSKR